MRTEVHKVFPGSRADTQFPLPLYDLPCQTVSLIRQSCAGNLVDVSPRIMGSSYAYLLVTFWNDSQATNASLFANDRDLISGDSGIDVAAAVSLDLEDALFSLLSPGNIVPDAAMNVNDPLSRNLSRLPPAPPGCSQGSLLSASAVFSSANLFFFLPV